MVNIEVGKYYRHGLDIFQVKGIDDDGYVIISIIRKSSPYTISFFGLGSRFHAKVVPFAGSVDLIKAIYE